MKNEAFQKVAKHRIVPVVRIDSASDAVLLAQALVSGGLPLVEITFRTDAAAESIRQISNSLPDVLVGAGTVLTPDQVDQAVDGGASFVVSPGFNPRVVDYCLGRGIPIVPGVSSPTHIELGLERGLSLFKFFPAEALGGLKLLTAMAAPYTGVRFMPTGGINIDNMRNYLASPMVVACGGTWMVKSDLIRDGKFDEITRLTREANAIVAAMPRETTA